MAISDEIREQSRKFKDMTFKEKRNYIWDYYKIHILVVIALIIFGVVIVRDVKDANKPTALYAIFINSNFALDDSNTIEDDFVRTNGIDLGKEHVYISFDINFAPDYFDTTTLAFQQKLVTLYTAGELDAVIGPVWAMESVADCGGYSDITSMLPQELIDELDERGYEFYTYNGKRYTDEDYEYMDEESLEEVKNFKPFVAGIYLDNCPYLNNQGEYGAYDEAPDEDHRPIFTIPVTTKHPEQAIRFLEFLIK